MESASGGPRTVKREAFFEHSAEEVIQWFTDSEKMLKSSEKMAANDVIESFSPNCSLIRKEMKGNLVVTNRDMSIFNYVLTLTDGSLAVINHSVVHDSIPETKCVRAEMELSVVIVQPISDQR